MENGYENIDFITDITWEDLQEIGITKLGEKSGQGAVLVLSDGPSGPNVLNRGRGQGNLSPLASM